MNREEAINIMSQMIKDEEGFLSDNTVEAHKMAIKALEQEPCADAVSRQAAIDIVDSYSESQSNVEDVTQDIISDISALPPVTPQSKTGHWIPVSEELPDKEGHYLCSVRYMYPPYNFFEPEKVKYMDDVTIQKFDGEFNIEVKAWMPLPKPYEPQERNGKK